MKSPAAPKTRSQPLEVVSIPPAATGPHDETKACGIFLLDDHPIMREGLAQLLSREVDLQVRSEERRVGKECA